VECPKVDLLLLADQWRRNPLLHMVRNRVATEDLLNSLPLAMVVLKWVTVDPLVLVATVVVDKLPTLNSGLNQPLGASIQPVPTKARWILLYACGRNFLD